MSPDNCCIEITKNQEKIHYLRFALSECKKIINSLEKNKEILENGRKITENIHRTDS